MIANFRKRKKGESLVFSIFLGLIALGIIGMMVFTNLKINQRRAELRAQIEALEREIQILEEKNRKLREGILETGKESYWEEKAREQGYVREGEKQVVVLPPKEIKEEGLEKEENFWNPQKWLEWLKSKLRD